MTIAWGDRSVSPGWVRRAADGWFEVRGEHAYSKPGTYKVVVKLADDVGKGVDAKVVSEAVVSR